MSVQDLRSKDVRPDFIPQEDEHLYPALGKPYKDCVPAEGPDPGNMPKDPLRSVDDRDNRYLGKQEAAWRARWELAEEEFKPAGTMGEWQARIKATQAPPVVEEKPAKNGR